MNQHAHTPPTPLPTYTQIDGERALQALVYAQGKPALAAERLGLKDADTLLAALVSDESIHERMRLVMRAFTLVRLLGVAESLEDTLMEYVHDDRLEPREVAKVFTSILTLADLMTRSPANNVTNNLNIPDTLLKVLPAEVRQALRIVQSNSMDTAILDSEPITAQQTHNDEGVA